MLEQLEDFNSCFALASEISQKQDREKLINVIEKWNHVNETVKPIFNDLIESFGFYPYLKGIDNLEVAALIRNEYHKSSYLKTFENENIIFHFEQKILEEKISNKCNLLVSAPTSFGKSLLIEEFVARKQYENILIIQPTLALIDETRRKLKKYSDFYSIIVNTKQQITEKNIFILTSERVLEIYPKLDKIDLFIVDEFYKISNQKKDERVSQLNISFYKIVSMSPQLLLLTPKIDDVSKEFIDKYKLEFFKTEYSLVNQKTERVNISTNKQEELFKMLNSLSEPTIVYVQSPNQAEKLAKAYIDGFKCTKKRIFPIFEWIDENISPNWRLKNFLENGIGLHNGQYPRHVVNSQLDYFNEGLLNVIFATTSLIEGVNTVAKNIIIYDMKKGSKKGVQDISNFDYNNIKGRAGRMMKYYTGNIYYFDSPPEEQSEILDIPIIDQSNNLQSEILINIEKKDMKNERVEEFYSLVRDLPHELLEIFKNNYYNVESQKRLYYHLKLNEKTLSELLWTTPTPTYDILLRTMEVINHYLDGENGGTYKYLAHKCQQVMRENNLKIVILKEVAYQKTLTQNKSKTTDDIENSTISSILKFVKNKSGYEIPKKLSILESIVNYISSSEKADYSSFIALLEHEGIDERLGILLDYGVPSSALKKIRYIPDDNILTYIIKNIEKFGFNQYEMEIIKSVL